MEMFYDVCDAFTVGCSTGNEETRQYYPSSAYPTLMSKFLIILFYYEWIDKSFHAQQNPRIRSKRYENVHLDFFIMIRPFRIMICY